MPRTRSSPISQVTPRPPTPFVPNHRSGIRRGSPSRPSPPETSTGRAMAGASPVIGSSSRHAVYVGLGESLDEREHLFRDLSPTAVDGQRVTAVGHLLDLGHALVA